MKRINPIVFVGVLVAVVAAVVLTRGTSMTPSPSPTAGGSTAPGPLHAMSGWSASLLTDDVSGARDMVQDQFGNVWVSQTSQGTVSLIYLKDAPAGTAPVVSTVLKGLRKPHGLAFDPDEPSTLYIATETSIVRLPTYSDGGPKKIADLPAGGSHFTRSLVFGTDKRLYVSIGSTCNVCHEKNPEIATIISMNKDGSDRRTVATGLRNAVFLAIDPSTHGLFTTEMGRDNLGDNIPPDEIDLIKPGANYGWPICYGDRINDREFDKNVYIRDPCADSEPPFISIPAHSAPLGLAFIPSGWPSQVSGKLLVALHGSWNRSTPIGYKVVMFDPKQPKKEPVDFLTGFANGTIGRPVDVLPLSDGTILVSDDKKGAIWKVSRP